jgi:hypothetical protein
MPRLQVDVTDRQLDDLTRVMKECELNTKRELFNNAFTLLEWAIDARKKGHIIASIDESDEKYYELRMPILNNVRPSKKPSQAGL